MNVYEELIETVNEILNTVNSFESPREKQNFLAEKIDVLHTFKNSLTLILRAYYFKENGNEIQNNLSNKLKKCILSILQHKNFWESQPQFEYFISELLDGLNYSENKFSFDLQFETNMDNVKEAIEYLQTRNDYLRILEEQGFFQDETLNGSSALSYKASKYEENMLGHALIQIKNNFLKCRKEDIISIIQCIDNSNFFDVLIQKSDKEMDFYDKNLIFQYTDTILKIKSIFSPEIVKDDKFVQAMWNGKIKDITTIQSIIQNISVNTLYGLLNPSDENTITPFIFDIAERFKQLDLSDKQISTIINELLNKEISSYEIANVLAKIDVPGNYTEFVESEHSQEYPWLLDSKLFQTLKTSEKKIEDAYMPYLPAEYYAKKIDTISSSPNIDKSFIQNVITLLHSDFYTEDEKQLLINSLKRNQLYLSEYITDENISFEPNDTYITTYKKVITAYFSGQVIPLDIAVSIINQLMTKPKKINSEVYNRKLLEACIQSIISNQLLNKGVDIGNRVFFGNGHSHDLGYYQHYHNCIWIDYNLILKFLNSSELTDKAAIFRTMFHEMRHAVQHHNIDIGNIDYLTYNFIKEYTIECYDENFYNNNYISIYTEADARKEEILGSLEFLKGLNPEFVKILRENTEKEYVEETCYHTIYGDSEKEIGIGKNGTKINISNYLGLLIQANPQILTESPILSMEYNLDGSSKDLETLLREFHQMKGEKPTNYSNFYSIYYGLISRAVEQETNSTPQLQEQIAEFFQEQPDMITLADMQVLYKKVPPSKVREIYSKLLALTRNITPII